jgi:hypothetical protein
MSNRFPAELGPVRDVAEGHQDNPGDTVMNANTPPKEFLREWDTREGVSQAAKAEQIERARAEHQQGPR